MSFKVLFEDDQIIAVHKDHGIDFHSSEGELGLSALVQRDLDLHLFPVHRLDKVTSGVVVFAKSKDIASKLSILFQEKRVEKTYLAISTKKPKKKMGTIKGDMEKSRRGTFKLARTLENPAVTSFESELLDKGLRLFILRPKTGKTHQLRVMMKSIGSPILGDLTYSGDGADRTYLHAYKISFDLEGESYSICSNILEGDIFTRVDSKLEKKLAQL